MQIWSDTCELIGPMAPRVIVPDVGVFAVGEYPNSLETRDKVASRYGGLSLP